jgi:hypothetical protein
MHGFDRRAALVLQDYRINPVPALNTTQNFGFLFTYIPAVIAPFVDQ